MSAHAYIQTSDIPRPLLDHAARRVDVATRDSLIALIGCPLTGIEIDDEVQFPFPRAPEIRDSLVGWLVHWGISFRVEL